LPRPPKTGPMRSRSTPCCCAPCSRRSTHRSTAATLAWRSRPTPISPARSGATPTCWCTGSSRPFWPRRKYQLPALPTPGEAHAKLAGGWKSAGAPGTKPPRAKAAQAQCRDAGLGGRRPALQRQRAPRRRGQPRRRGLAQVQVHARAPGRRIWRRGQRGHQLRHVCDAGCDVCRRPGAHHRTGRRILPFDEARQELRGERTGIRYAIGTRVRVQVSRVDLDGRRIDFRPNRVAAPEPQACPAS
jgi:ribonuclease R